MTVTRNTLRVLRSFGKQGFTESSKIRIFNYFFVNKKFEKVTDFLEIGDELVCHTGNTLTSLLSFINSFEMYDERIIKDSNVSIHFLTEKVSVNTGKSHYSYNEAKMRLDRFVKPIKSVFNFVKADESGMLMYSLMNGQYEHFAEADDPDIDEGIEMIKALIKATYVVVRILFKLKVEGKQEIMKRTWNIFGEEYSIAAENYRVAQEFGVLPYSTTSNTTEIVP